MLHKLACSSRLVVVAALLLPAWGCGNDSRAVESALQAGDDAYAAGELKKAFSAYSKAIQLDAQCKKAYICRGQIYNDAGKPEKAIRDFTKAIEIDPRDSYPYEQRAQVYRKSLHDEAKATADDEAAAAIRQQRWTDLQKLRKKG